jgi:hypothetical protein
MMEIIPFRIWCAGFSFAAARVVTRDKKRVTALFPRADRDTEAMGRPLRPICSAEVASRSVERRSGMVLRHIFARVAL